MGQQRVIFVDFKPEGAQAAVALPAKPTLTVEKVVSVNSLNDIKELAKKTNPKARYTRVVIGTYPDSRLLRYGVLENPSKARETDFFDKYIKENYQISLEDYSVGILNPASGKAVDLDTVVPKELIFCGARTGEFTRTQNELIGKGLFPDRLELGSISTLGGLQGYLKAQQITHPAVMLEWGETDITMMVPSARRVELVRTIRFGTQQLLKAMASDLGLKDKDSVERMLTNASFDLTEMGGSFLKGFLKELQASMGFFEVQTGQTIQNFLVTLLPEKLRWVQDVLSRFLGMELLKIDYTGWANLENIRLPEDVEFTCNEFPLFSLMAIHQYRTNEGKKNS